MISEYRFFHEFFDGQVVKKESDRYKLFKLVLFSCFSAIGLFFVMSGFSGWGEFVLLELGMLWNIYSNIDKKVSLFFCVLVSILYFYFASGFEIYSNGLIYIAGYIPLQMMAISKDYSEGSFVQIKKKITDYNKILFIMFFVGLFVVLSLFNFGVDGKYVIFDALSASLLICSAVLRNERYFEHYVFRIFALVMTIFLWIMLAVSVSLYGSLLIICMYSAYLIFDVGTLIYQNSTYINEYMIEQRKAKEEEKQKIIEQKLETYKLIEEIKVKQD